MNVVKMPRSPNFEVRPRLVAGVLAVVVGLLFALTAFYTVDPQEEGLVLRFGRHVRTTGPGLHMKLPLGAEGVIKVPVATVDVEEFGYRSRRAAGPRGRDEVARAMRQGFEEESTMLTGDLNIVQVGWDVQYRRSDPEKYLFEVQEPVQTLRDLSQSVMRQVVGDRASIQVLTTERAEIQEEAKSVIQDVANNLGMGLQVVEVNLLFVEPPSQVLDAFHDLNKAEQDAQRFFEEASREYEEQINRARGIASRTVEEAEGYRQRRVNVATGEAGRFVDLLAEYSKAPEVTRRRLYLETLEGVLTRVDEVVVIGEDGATAPLPLLNLTRRDRSAAERKEAE